MLRKILLTLSLLTLGLVSSVHSAHAQTVNSFDGVNLHWQPQGSPEILTPMGTPPACPDGSGSPTLQSCNTASEYQPAIGNSFTYTPSVGNTGTISALINGYGPYPFKKCLTVNLSANDFIAGVPMIITFTGTTLQVYNTASGCGGGGGGGGFTAGGDLSGSSTSQTVIGINNTNLAALASGFLFNTTATGVPVVVGFTGTGSVVRATSPSLVSPALGTPTAINLSNATSLPCGAMPALSGDVTSSAASCAVTVTKINGTSFTGTAGHLVSFGAVNVPQDSGLVAANEVNASAPGVGVAHFAGSTQTVTSSAVTPSDATGNTSGSGNFCLTTSCTMVTPVLGTPASGVLTNVTGYLWNILAAPTGNLSLAMGSNSSIFTTTTAVSQFFAWKNNTAALVGTSQASPILSLCGTAFHGSASVEDCLTFQDTPGNGNDAAITFNVGHSGTSTGVVTTAFSGPVAAGNDGVHAGLLSLPGNTTLPTGLPSNAIGIIGPNSASFTSYFLQLGVTAPSGTQYLGCGTPSSNVSTCSWNTISGSGTVTSVVIAGTASQITASGTCTITTSGTCTLALAGAAGEIFAGATPALTFTPTLGVSGTAGTLSLFPASGNFTTTLGSAATASNTVNFFATAPTTGDLVDCVTSSTTCTLTDSGVLAANVTTNSSNYTSGQVTYANGSHTQTSSANFTFSGAALTLGVSGTAGTLLTFPASGNFTTTWGSAATASNTILGPATVVTTLHEMYCVVSSTTCTLTDTGYAYNAIPSADISALAESKLTGSAAATTITETGTGDAITRSGVETGNLTTPYVFINTNSTNNNTSIGLGVSTPGTSTGQTTLNVNGAATGGDLADFGTGGSWSAGVLSGQTILAKVTITGAMSGPSFTSTGTTAGFIDFPQGSTSAAVAPCNVATSRCVQAPTAMTASVETLDGGESQGARFTTGSTSAFQDMSSGDANHSATVTTGSGTSIGSTSLCSTANCPAGTYQLNAYIDITTACGTSGTYTVSVVYTDDQGSKTFVLPLTGTGSVPATGVLTTTSTSNWGEASIVLRSTGAASINYLTTATACGSAGPMVGKLYLSVEAVQ